jgi:hypothetical protein
MNNPLRIAIAAAAVLVVALIGFNVLPRQGGIGGPTVTPSPAPTASPTSSPSPSPSSSRVALQAPRDIDTQLKPGTYQVATPFAMPFAITFTSNWTPKALTQGDVEFLKSSPIDGNLYITADLIEGVFTDPCHSSSGATKAPTTLAGVVQALTHMVGFTAGPVTDVTIGGYTAKHVVITNSIDTATAGCTQGPMLPILTWRGGPSTGAGTNGGLTEELWFVEFNGTIVVIDGETGPTTAAADRLEIGTTVSTITFQP